MRDTPKRQYYVNDGLTEEGQRLYWVAHDDHVCPLHRVPITGRKRIWCGQGEQVNGGVISCYWAFHEKYGMVRDWKITRAKALERDGHACVNCGAAQKKRWDPLSDAWLWSDKPKLEADHIIEIRDGGAEFDLSNVRTLCHRCHVAKTVARTRGWQAERALKLIRTPQPTLGDRDPKEART